MLAHAAKISIDLVRMLEDSDVNITHPKIANRLASLMGASAAERDSLVAEQHAGQPLNGGAKPLTLSGLKPYERQKFRIHFVRRVKRIDNAGNTICIYSSIIKACMESGDSEYYIASRCAHKVQKEFKNGYTYRYLEDEL